MLGPRRQRVADAVQEAVARLIQQEMHALRAGLLTVTGVRMTSDLKRARVFVSVLEEGAERERTFDRLQAARRFVRRRVGDILRLRYTPEIEFVLDTSLEDRARLERLIVEGLPPAKGKREPDVPED